jgi:FtsZ-interacting cell division protein ZipA
VSTGTIVLIIVIAVIVLALIGLAMWMGGKKKREHRHAEAERIRQEAAAHAGGLQESQVQAREAEARAEQARLQAQRAEEEAARAHQGVSQEKALHEDRLREADRLDPNVDHRSDDYNPDTRAAETRAPAYDETGRVDPAATGTRETAATTGTTGTTGTTDTAATTGTTGTTRVDDQGRPIDEHGRLIEDPSEPGGTHRAP